MKNFSVSCQVNMSYMFYCLVQAEAQLLNEKKTFKRFF